MMPDYKYNEDKYVSDIKRYLDGTYGEHYVAKDIQVVDIWHSLGSLESTARDTAIKYLCRYGKKDGKNKKDLLKAIHYIILMMYADEEEEKREKLSALQQQPIDLQMQDIRDAYERVDYHDSHTRK
jgi:hypothetical protein